MSTREKVNPPALGAGETRSVTEVLDHFKNGSLAQGLEHADSTRKVPGETPG